MRGVPNRGRRPGVSVLRQSVLIAQMAVCPMGGRTSPRLLFQVVDEEPPLNLGRNRSADGECWVPFRCVSLMCWPLGHMSMGMKGNCGGEDHSGIIHCMGSWHRTALLGTRNI